MTAWPEILTGEAWRRWLLACAGGRRVRRGLPIDPFGTSARTFSTQMHGWLTAIEQATPLAGERRWEQALIDARSIGLVVPGTERLSPFGVAVLRRWSGLEQDFSTELPHAVAFVLTAIEHRQAQHLESLAYWRDVRALCGEQVLDDPDVMLLLPFVNQRLERFNPWELLLASGAPLRGPLDWEATKASVPRRDSSTDAALDALRDKGDRRELRGRLVYCRAMDLVLSQRDPAAVAAQLDGLMLPV